MCRSESVGLKSLRTREVMFVWPTGATLAAVGTRPIEGSTQVKTAVWGIGIVSMLLGLSRASGGAEDDPNRHLTQEPRIPRDTSWDECRAKVAPLWAEAERAVASGDPAGGAERFVSIASGLPESTKRLSAWLAAASATARAGELEAARLHCETAYCEATRLLTQAYDGSDRHPKSKHAAQDSVKDILRRALLHKAELCLELKDSDAARAAIHCLRAQEPEYFHLRAVLPIQSRLEGLALERLKADEHAASLLSDRAKHALLRERDLDSAMQLASETIKKYPGTGGALLAARTKARCLHMERRFNDARQVYGSIVKALEGAGVSFESELYKEAVAMASRYDAIELSQELVVRVHKGLSIAPIEWQALNGLLETSRNWCKDEDIRLDTCRIRLEVLFYQGAYQEMVEEGRVLLRRFAKRHKDYDRKQVEHVYTWLGYGLYASGRFADSVTHFEHAVQAYRGAADAWDSSSPYRHALFGLRLALRAEGSDVASIESIESEILQNAPESSYATRILSGE